MHLHSEIEELNIDPIPDPFWGCSSLESITVDSNNPNMTSVDGVLMTKDMKKIIRCPQAKTSFTVPDGVMKVGFNAFKRM